MGTKERTLKEIMDNPESMTDDEKESLKKIGETFSEFAKSMEAYKDIDIKDNNNNAENIFKRHSSEYYVMAIVLESFFYCNKLEISFKELNSIIYEFSPKDLIWDTSVTFVNAIITKMIFLSLIEPIETENKYIPNFRITEDGIRAFQDHRFQNLAATSFANQQSHKTNSVLLRISKISLFTAIISAAIAFGAIIISIAK